MCVCVCVCVYSRKAYNVFSLFHIFILSNLYQLSTCSYSNVQTLPNAPLLQYAKFEFVPEYAPFQYDINDISGTLVLSAVVLHPVSVAVEAVFIVLVAAFPKTKCTSKFIILCNFVCQISSLIHNHFYSF